MDETFAIDFGDRVKQRIKDVLKYDLAGMCSDREMALLAHNKINTNNRFKPAAQKLFSKPFAYKQSEDFYWSFKRHIDRVNTTYSSIYLARLKTTKGSIYFCYFPEEQKIQSFTAHLFDRYKERNHLKNRDEAIKKFMSELLMSIDGVNDRGPLHSQDYRGIKGYNVVLAVNSGLLLGNRFNKTLLFKTYITKEMCSPEEQRIYSMLRSNSH